MIPENAVWLVTGSSKGLGRAIAEAALAEGYRVVATARRVESLADLVAAHPDRSLALPLDVTDPAAISDAVQEAEARFGAIDVLVNNAGYGYLAAVEEGDPDDARAQLETNLWGPISMLKAVLPGMRQRRRGHIVNMSSIGGFVTNAGAGYYHMTKFAIEAMSDVLAKEVAPLGIGVTAVAPGAFRTDFRGPDSIKQSSTIIEDYAETAGGARERAKAGHGKQPGDPNRGARAIIEAVQAERPPVHLVLGSDALDQYRAKLDEQKRESDAWEPVTRSTDFAVGFA